MGTVLGLVLGAGVFCIWWAWWTPPQKSARASDGWRARMADQLVQAGAPGVSPQALLAVSAALGAVVWILVAALTGSAAIGLFLAAIAARGPHALVTYRAEKRRAAFRDVWPEAVDHLASGIRAGLSLPDAIGQIGDRGPEQLRPAFVRFAQDYRATGQFAGSLDALKARLADPVADRILECLRVTRDVGGSDLGAVLRALSSFLREDLRTRGELESRQSWTVNAARLAVAAPWVVLVLLAGRPEAAAAYNTPAGVTVLALGAASTLIAYRVMVRIGRLPTEQRVLR